jgi:hypothetical protein
VYEHYVDGTTESGLPIQDSVCQIVAIEHAIRGPLESKPTDSATFFVMGQRVWLDTSAEVVAKGLNVYAAVQPLTVGSIVEVSGHLTADGDLLATGIHAAASAGNYHLTGLARNVDAAAKQLQLGTLTVYYADAAVVGFANGAPAEGDRMDVWADVAPTAGTLRAGVVRYAGGLPRGSDGTVVKLGGLVTRYTSATHFAVEGRSTVADSVQGDPASVAAMRCDLDKVHTDMRFVSLLAYGITAGETPQYFFALCPPGRRIDSRGPPSFPDTPLSIMGPLVSVDPSKLTVRVGGVDVALTPDALLTQFVQSAPDGSGVTTRVRVADLKVGDRVKVATTSMLGALPVAQYVLLGDPAVSQSEVQIVGGLRSAAGFDLILEPGLSVQVTSTTTLQHRDCSGEVTVFTDPAALWALGGDGALVAGSVRGGVFVAEKVEIFLSASSCI